jgi:proteasome lid subunit RPN8/RPN11
MGIIKEINKKLSRVITGAAISCPLDNEEEGGIILTKNEIDFVFVKVKNLHAGEEVAYGLYVTDPKDFGEKVISMIGKGWNMYASFHTHPQFAPTPSQLDYDKLFQGFKYNYIYSKKHRAFSFSEWSPQKDLHTFVMGLETLLHITNNE